MNKFTILVFLISTLLCNAQTPSINTSPPLSHASPKSEGMSAERLARIDTMINSSIQDGDIPGAVVLVARNGKIVYHKAFGLADYQAGEPFETNDIFRIASMTKAVTATAVMMLWEEGKFHLDDPISYYIPEFKDPQVLDSFNEEDTSYTTVAANKEITIRHLLTHTSGIGYGAIGKDERIKKIYPKAGIIDVFTTKDITIEENIKKLATLPLIHHPGEDYTYSEGLDVLGYLIEQISGMPLDKFFETRIFNPLGMNDTYFYLPESKYDRLVPVQSPINKGWQKFPAPSFYDPDYPKKGAKAYFAGGAGLSSTAVDYATFVQMYLNKGEMNGKRLLSRTTVEFMMENQYDQLLWDRKGSYYALAFEVVNEKGEALGGKGSEGTFGWGGYFNTHYFADPEENYIGILMKQTQETKNDETRWKFRQLVGAAVDD